MDFSLEAVKSEPMENSSSSETLTWEQSESNSFDPDCALDKASSSLQVKLETHDSCFNQAVNSVTNSEAEDFILPDVTNQSLNSDPLLETPEAKENSEIMVSAPEEQILGSSGYAEELTLIPRNSVPSSSTAEKRFESEMDHEDDSTISPQEFLDVQLVVSSHEQVPLIGRKGSLPSTTTSAGGELITADLQPDFEDNGCLESLPIQQKEKDSSKTSNKRFKPYDIKRTISNMNSLDAAQTCLHCNKIFECNSDFERHHLSHKGDPVINKCCHCGGNFIVSILKKDNAASNRNMQNQNYRAMGIPINSRITLLQNRPSTGNTNSQVIENCLQSEVSSTLQADSEVILGEHSPSNSFSDNNRQEGFTRALQLIEQQRSHATDKTLPHKCNRCEKAFEKRADLKIHLFSHSGEKAPTCSFCSKEFMHIKNLRNHIKCVHSSNKPHKCTQCGKAFPLNCTLKLHLLTHTGEKPYKCSQCEMAFTTKRYLDIHSFLHSGKMPHKCNQCDMAFPRIDRLKSHLLTHTQEKPHLCCRCGRSFGTKYSLKTHMLLHTGEKPHKCCQCERTFTQKSSLNAHVLSHSHEENHKCDQCGKTFRQKTHLKKHSCE